MDVIELVQNAALVAFVAIVVTTDWRSHRIPNVVTYPAMLLGLVLATIQQFPGAVLGSGLLDHLAGLAVALLGTLPLYAAGGLKAGDVKLLMAVGALKGLGFLFWTLIFGALLGGLIAIGYIGIERLVRRRSVTEILKSFIPYGVALGLGALAALVVELGPTLSGEGGG
jgi:prepilin peptidase CpaA